MTDCKHTIKPGETRVWTGESKSPPYACGLCEMERLRSTLELARVALWLAFDEVRQSPKYVDRPSTFVGAKINEALEAIEKVREGPMMCPRGCGVEVRVGMLDYAQEVGDDCAEHTDARCADALSAQLATMTKRAEEAEERNHVADECARGCARDARMQHLRADAAEAKLATAVRFIGEVARIPNPGVDWQTVAWSTLHALGVNPTQAATADAEHWEDAHDEWSSQINNAHPVISGSHAAYVVAMRMVGNRRSKSELVALVNWLLTLIGEPVVAAIIATLAAARKETP